MDEWNPYATTHRHTQCWYKYIGDQVKADMKEIFKTTRIPAEYHGRKEEDNR
jgi:hypothetical protein